MFKRLRRKPILQVFEEAFALFVVVVFQAVLKGFQGFALGAVQLLGDLHIHDDVLVTAAAAVQILDALAAQAELGTALGAFGDLLGDLSVHGGNLDLGTQHSLGVGDGHADVHIIAVALKHGVGLDRHMYDHVTGRAAVATCIALAAQCNVLIVIDTGRDLDLQRLAGGSLAGAAAGLAGVLDDGTAAAAVRAGLLALPASAAVLAAVLLLVSTSWQGNALLQKVLCVLLAISSALEILRLHALFGSVYPGTLGLAGTCFVVLAPVIYLRREPALRQTANALLVFGATCMAIMVLSVAPRLRVPNLHAAPLTGQDWQAAFVSQLALPPEYLLFALWPPQPGQRCRKAVTFAASALGFDAAVHLLLELFFGAAMPTRQTPVQGAAQCGALSIFNRLEWLQILLWCMVVTVRLALYLYAMVELWGGRAGAGSAAAGLDRYPLYFGGMALLCAVLRTVPLEQAFYWRSAVCWGFAAVVMVTGGCQWLVSCIKHPA